ncbi:MAG: energy transducer TonB [Bacteroidetes bacterium]|nr:energy transducer TonB [Bacteroidota bacterium]
MKMMMMAPIFTILILFGFVSVFAQLKAPPLSQPKPVPGKELPVDPSKSKPKKNKKGQIVTQRDANDLSQVVAFHDQDMRLLFETYKQRDPNLSGKVEFSVTIKPDGKVATVKALHSTLKNPAFTKSLTTRIKLWKFSKIDPKSAIQTIKVPYIFSR